MQNVPPFKNIFLDNPCQIFGYLQNIHFEIVKDFLLEWFPGEDVISI